MIYYLVTPKFEHTVENYLAHWAPELEPRFKIVFYNDILRARELPLGTYIFSDLERLLPSETEIATRIWDQLNAAGARLLNHPTRTLKRYDLLTMLHAKGRNRFRVVRASESTKGLNFPVFLREEGEHSGSLTKLLTNRQQLDEALVGATMRQHRLSTMLVVEYLNTADQGGIFRKYAAFMIGGRVVPAHVDCSRGWMVKDTDIVDPSIMDLELDYVRSNPHREWLEETFALAGVDYGRMDYSLLPGAMPQLWEINTNPVVILTPDHYSEIHMPVKRAFASSIGPAFEAIDTPGGRMIPIEISRELIARLDAEQRGERAFRARRQFMRRVVRWKVTQGVRKVIRPMMTPISPLLARFGRSRETRKKS